MLGRRLLRLWEAPSTQGIEGPQDLGCHPDAAPLLGSGDERGKEEHQTRPFPREPGDHLAPPPALSERPLQEIRRPDAPVVRRGEQQAGYTLLEIRLQTLHGRRESGPESGNECAPTTERGPVIRGQEDLLDQRLQFPLGEAGELGQDVPHLVDLTALSSHSGEDLADGLREAGVTVYDDQEWRRQASDRQVVQEGHPGIGALSGTQAEVYQHRPAIFQNGAGGQDPFLFGGPAPHRVELAVEEEVENLQLAKIAGAPGVEVRMQRAGRPTGGTLREATSEHLGVEPCDVTVGQAAHVGARDQGLQLRGGRRESDEELDPEHVSGRAHLQGAQGEGACLGLERVGAVAVPPAARRDALLIVASAQEEGLDLLLQADLEHQLGGAGDELMQRVAGITGLQLCSQRLLHLDARWYPLHGVVAPFSVHSGRSGVATGRIPYAASFLYRA